MKLTTLNDLVLDWADKRGILEHSSTTAQMVKLLEEYGELASGVAKNDEAKIKDSIGDCLVVAIIMRGIGRRTDCVFDKLPQFESFCVDTYTAQMAVVHCVEYLGRVAWQLNRPMDSSDNIIDEQLTDFVRSLRDVAYHFDTTLDECLALAWDEIKDRRGIMSEDGVFIKVADLEQQLFQLDKKIAEEVFYKRDVTELKSQADELQDLIVKAKR